MSTHEHDHGNDHDEDDRHDRGLQYDLGTLWQRRRFLTVLSGVALASIVGCATEEEGASGTSTPSSSTPFRSATGVATAAVSPSVVVPPIPSGTTPASACITIPNETAGPFPGDGSNGPNALTQSGIVRSDLRTSFGSGSGTAAGVPLTIQLTIVDTKNNCAPMPGAAVYLWHCDREGRYSMYSQGVTNENYLRGVQEADANGVVRYTSIFPAAYMGRWPHAHFEVYRNLSQATSSANKLATSQLALPEDVSNAVYATAGYEQSVRNMTQTPLSRDMVFSDSVATQMATVAGSVSAEYAASLVVGI